MGLTLSNVKKQSIGSEFEVRCDAVWNSTYAQGGASLTPAMLGLDRISHLEAKPKSGYIFEWIPTTNKLMVYKSAAIATHVHDVKLIGGITATEPVAVQGGDTLGKNAATDRTIAGANSATKGGIVAAGAVAQSALAEVTTGDTLSSTPGSFVLIARGL